MLKCDFHIHTTYSEDSTMSVDALIERCLKVGLNCIAVTDHDEIEGAIEAKAKAPFQVIVGEEITSASGHIIGLFLNEKIPPGLSVHETISRIKAQGGVAIAPHPFSRLADDSLQQAFVENHQLFDAVEVANSNNLFRWDDKKALKFAENQGLLKVTGSDTHRTYGVGKNIVHMPEFSCPDSFLKALPSARFDNRLHNLQYFMSVGIWVLKDKFRRYRANKEACETKQVQSKVYQR